MRLSGASGSFKTEERQTQHEIRRQLLSVLISDFGCKLREGMHIKVCCQSWGGGGVCHVIPSSEL